MELKIVEGKYVINEFHALSTTEGFEEIIQRITMKLRAKRGSFLPLPDFGSRLYTLGSIKPSLRETAARQFVLEALSDETGLVLESLSLLAGEGDTGTLSLLFSFEGGSFELETGF
ncbi:MAG: hypothetical protein RSD32_02725 [Oscillospiraceae bacterium]